MTLHGQGAALVELETAADLHAAGVERFPVENEHRLGTVALRQVAIEHRRSPPRAAPPRSIIALLSCSFSIAIVML